MIAMLLSAFTASAQLVTFGVKGGANFASMNGDDADGLDGRTSFHIGALAELGLTDAFSLQPELLYSGQGFSDSFDGFDVTGKVDYLNIPVMAKYYVIEGLSIEAGPQFGVLTSAEVEGEGESEDIKDLLKTSDFALNIGAGYKMNSGVNFNLRYSLGMTDIPEEGDGDFKHGVLQVSLGYFF